MYILKLVFCVILGTFLIINDIRVFFLCIILVGIGHLIVCTHIPY